MPPNKLIRGSGQLTAWFNNLPVVKQVRLLAGAAGGRTRQRFYPQCQRCSIKQANALRNNTRILMLHLHLPRYRSEHLAGGWMGAGAVWSVWCLPLPLL